MIVAVILISACNDHSKNSKLAEQSKKKNDTLKIHDFVINDPSERMDANTLICPEGLPDSIGGLFKVEESEKKASFKFIELDQGCKLIFYSDVKLPETLKVDIIQGIRDIMSKVQKLLPADSITIDLELSTRAYDAGRAFDAHNIWLGMDPEKPDFKDDKVLQFLLHELHHASRFRMPEKKRSMIVFLVEEGLAQHFVVEMHHREATQFSRVLTEEEIHKYLKQVKPFMYTELSLQEEYDIVGHWFLGIPAKDDIKKKAEFPIPTWSNYPKEENIPLFTGYSLGWRIVENYLKVHPKASASSLVHAPAEVFVESTPELLK